MTVTEQLNTLLNFDKKLSKKLEKVLQNHLTYKEYTTLKNHINFQEKYLNPTYDYDDFKKQRDMITCILYSTIGQESQDWIKEWSDIPYKVFTGVAPNSYEYDQIKQFIENYYRLLKQMGGLKMFIDEEYYVNAWREKHKDKKQEYQEKLKRYQEMIKDYQAMIERLG